MPDAQVHSGWNILPPVTIALEDRLEHVRSCSDFAAGLLDRYPDWGANLDECRAPEPSRLAASIRDQGLEPGLRRFRNHEMLRIVWRDLSGLATLAETFSSLTVLAELCLQAAIGEHQARLEEKHGIPRAADGAAQRLFVIGLGKFGGGELNLSSDIDVMFCFPESGASDGRRSLSNDQFFTRLARAVIASLAEITADGFCFRVDTRLRPFGDSGPLTSSLAAMEQYYQREGRDWERYALIKARPVAGDLAAGANLIERLRPFVYRRYIDYGSVEALQEMHTNVREDARRRDRFDDIKRGPGGIREIEFLAQCFQILRGGREPGLQTPSLDLALAEIGRLELLDHEAVSGIRNDYVFLRLLENRIQALRDQQTHRLPAGEDRVRIARAMYEDSVEALDQRLERTRRRTNALEYVVIPELRDTRKEVEQKIGESLPLDLQFRDENGETVELGRYFGERPVMLSLVYFECPMLCNMALNGLVSSLRALDLQPGKDFDIVTVSFDPSEGPELAAAKKAHYVEELDRPGIEGAWHFLTGDAEAIERLTSTVGFRYVYDEATKQYAHASGLIVTTPQGQLARYFYGIEYSPRDLRLGLVEASEGKLGSVVDQALLFCFRYDPEAGTYAAAALNLIRLAGAITVLGIAAMIVLLRRGESRRAAARLGAMAAGPRTGGQAGSV